MGTLRRTACVISILFEILPTNLIAAQQGPTDRLIQSLQSRASTHAGDPTAFDALGTAYIQKGRETGDASYYELARQALSKSLDLLSNDPAAASATTHMALVYMAEHRFEEALTWAQDLLALGSGDPTPWGIVGDALTDIGEYEKAEEAYARLRDPAGGQDVSGALSSTRDARLSYLRFLRGDAESAAALMRNAIRSAVKAHLPGENVAWDYYQLADEMFRAGDFAGAERAYLDGLAVSPLNYRCLAGLAQVRTAQERFQDAIHLYQKALAVVPFPEYAAALGDVYARVGRPDEARKQYDLVEFTASLSRINKVLYNRDLALFYADHGMRLKDSLELARKELEVRHDIYTWDALAWALQKNGEPQAAAEAMTKALRLNTKDALLFFHAGVIYARAGDAAKSRQYVEKMLVMNPAFQSFYAEGPRKLLAGRR